MLKNREKLSYQQFEEKFNSYFVKAAEEIFGSNRSMYSDFIQGPKLSNSKIHPHYTICVNFLKTFKNKNLLRSLTNKQLMTSMDHIICMYIFGYWTFSTSNENYINLKIGLLLREFMNFYGWEYYDTLAKFKIMEVTKQERDGLFSNALRTECLPEIFEDFIGYFLKSDAPGFNKLSEVKNFISEICSFVYKEEFTNFLIEPF